MSGREAARGRVRGQERLTHLRENLPMHRSAYLSLTLLLAFTLAPARGDGLKILPGEVDLRGPQAAQRLLVVVEKDGKVTDDVTGAATLRSSAPAVAAVDEGGTVRAAGDGEATVTAEHEGKRAAAKVKVSGTRLISAPTFRNQVIPVMTRLGCNS